MDEDLDKQEFPIVVIYNEIHHYSPSLHVSKDFIKGVKYQMVIEHIISVTDIGNEVSGICTPEQSNQLDLLLKLLKTTVDVFTTSACVAFGAAKTTAIRAVLPVLMPLKYLALILLILLSQDK